MIQSASSIQLSSNQLTSNQQSSNQTSSNQLFSIYASANQSFPKLIVFYFYEFFQLNKTYRIEKKFDKTKNNLKFKFVVFYNKCKQIELFEKTWNQVASIMLKNQTLIFYYNNDQYISWFDFIETLKKFFENLEWKWMNLIKWQIINLIDVIINNISFSTFECFVKLMKNMNFLQWNLKNQFSKIFFFCENIIRTVWNHSAMMTEFINSSNNVVDLINNLHFSIINYETMHRSFAHENYAQFYNDEMKKNKTKNKIFFIDCCYQNNRVNFRDRNRFFMKSRTTFFWKSFKILFQRQKKCFVCEKINCWSTNHIQQKRNDSIKKFENQKSHFRIRPDFNKKMRHWIIECENENSDETIHFFNQLIINFETYNMNFNWLEKIESNSFNSH